MNKAFLSNIHDKKTSRSLSSLAKKYSKLFGRGIIFVTTLLVISASVFSFLATDALSEQAPPARPLEEVERSFIYPGSISSASWSGAEVALRQDLSEYALYQEFTIYNSASLRSLEDAPSGVPGERWDVYDFENRNTEENPVEVLEEIPSENPVPEELPSSSENQTFRSPVGIFVAYALQSNGLSRSKQQYRLLNAADVVEGTEEVVVVEVTDNATSTTEDSEAIPAEGIDLTFADFIPPPVIQGNVVEGINVRASVGAKLASFAEGEAPYIDVILTQGSERTVVGTILLDEEVSNAMNGGYFLFTLPATPITDLENIEITLRVQGDTSFIEDVFVDALWLELITSSVSPEDIEERGSIEDLSHLTAPEHSTLLSSSLNFSFDDTPQFNLQYYRQQNPIISNLRKLVGRDTVAVSDVHVIHKSIGEIDIDPEFSITDDGLLSIIIPNDKAALLPPGQYTLLYEIEENGNRFTDQFDFQWGVLAVNTSKAEYVRGETAQFSLAALSQDGNTLCEADIHLYITHPEGYVSKPGVVRSGLCNGNNVIDVPDYTAELPLDAVGEYRVYLERLGEAGEIVGFVRDTFTVVETASYRIERKGPTRIFPVAPYDMEMTVTVPAGFSGSVFDRVPSSFGISNTNATAVLPDGEDTLLRWDITAGEATEYVLQYTFDAPDISPFVYIVGEAWITTDQPVAAGAEEAVATDVPQDEFTATSTSEVPSEPDNSTSPESQPLPAEEPTENETEVMSLRQATGVFPLASASTDGVVFRESRSWKIASDATGSMLLMWDGPTIPAGWTCVSCVSGDSFFQRFIMGSSTPGINGGSLTHTHTVTATVLQSAGTVSLTASGVNDRAATTHTHTFTPTVGVASNLPLYRQLVIIQHNSAGEPTSIPAGAIAIFDAAVPAGWTQYAAQNGFYVRGESIANRTLTGGSNTHTHNITGTLGASAGALNANSGGTISVANAGHTHPVNALTDSSNHEPPFIEVILGRLNATTTLPDGVIGMWTDTQPNGWNVVSGPTQPFNNRIFKPAATYGATGGSETHAQGNVTITSGPPSSTIGRGGSGSLRSSGTHTHDIQLTNFSTVNHLPPFRTAIFAKRAGGAEPNPPTLFTLFDYERTGTSTPSFTFSANDPYGVDSIIYQFEWDDDSDLNDAPLGSRTSDNESGCSPNCFANTITPADTSPFNENETVRFTVPTPLTSGTTYYWRVRARKSVGTAWSQWSTIRSFTFDNLIATSEWHQTSSEQFASSTFTNSEAFNNAVQLNRPDVVGALTVYGEGTVQTPRYRTWDGTAWSAEQSALNIGGTVQWVRTAAGTRRNEYLVGVQDATNDVNVQIYNVNTNSWSNLLEVTATVSDTTRRGFDVAYESRSGRGIVVYCDGDSDPSYRIWNGSSWSAEATITTTSANNCNYITLAANPLSNEMIVVMRDTGSTYEAQVWNGTIWSNSRTFGSIVDVNNEGVAVAYESQSGEGMVVTSNGVNSNFFWASWNGTEWSTPLTQTIGDDFQWGVLKPSPSTNNIFLCYIDTDDDIGLVRWNGESWAGFTEIETSGSPDAGRPVSCEFEVTPGREGFLMAPYSDTAAGRFRFSDGVSIPAEATISTVLNSQFVDTVRTGNGLVLAAFHDALRTRYDFSRWNGSAWSTRETFETSHSVTAIPWRQPISMAAQVYQETSGSVTSTLVPFATLPQQTTWGEVSWNVTQPAGTAVTLQVLFATSTVCNVPVPDSALPGNSLGFSATSSPLNISGLSTTTYSTLCLRANFSTTNQNDPLLNDWTISWVRRPFLTQTDYRWYVNRNAQTPDDPWPVGVFDLAQNEPISSEYATGRDTVIRLRMSAQLSNATLGANRRDFKLQYTQALTCETATNWSDVGGVGSTTAEWRGFNNLLAFDGNTLSTLLLGGSNIAGTYEEENNSSLNPNSAIPGQKIEWDWVLQQNTAETGSQYCFRMVLSNGSPLNGYTVFPQLFTNSRPFVTLPSKPFDNEQIASTTPWFEFEATDEEEDELVYQIQIDNDADFSSVFIDRNSAADGTQFENVVTIADKSPFIPGQLIRFIPTTALSNGVTYYWRVRSLDPAGANDWSDWSDVQSLTVSASTLVTTWFQTTEAQWEKNSFVNTEAVGGDVALQAGQTTGTFTSTPIRYDQKTTGNAWGTLSWTHNVSGGSIVYRVEYLDDGEWQLIPDSALPNNTAGFTVSPVSLLGLDTSIYNSIRIVATFNGNSTVPRLQDLRVEWGFAVERPTTQVPFDNERVGTTTPRFVFTTTDPQNDDLQYEIAWSQDNTFTSGVTTRLSGVNAGFLNQTNNGDTSPFTSGNSIGYTIQPADALSNGVTYWWRVRARDQNAGNAWSVWSRPQSFTVSTSTTVSTWFQTTNEQFNTNRLNNLQATGGSVGIASLVREAIAVYAEGTVQTPRYRIWSGTSWSEELSALSVGNAIRFIETAAAPNRYEYVMATQEGSGRVRAQVFNGTSWGNLETIINTVPSITRRGFDVAYETVSGRAMVVACDGTEATYRIWNGTSWSAATPITLNVSTNCNWIKLASDPTSNEIILVVRDTIGGTVDYQALVWNGSAWGNSINFGSMAEAANQGIAVQYEQSGDRAVVVLSNGTGASFIWSSWNGTVWSTATAVALQDDFENGVLRRDPLTDNMVLCSINEVGQISYVRWNGSTNTWVTPFTTLTATGNSKNGIPVDCRFETTPGRSGFIMMPYSDTVNARYRFWNGSVLSSETTLSGIEDSWEVRTAQTGDGNILALFYDDVNRRYEFTFWNGSVWSPVERLGSLAILSTVPPTVPMSMTARTFLSVTEGTITSTPIRFSDGNGLKWQTATVNATRPGASTLRYRVEFQNSSGEWNLIPNSALPGNSTGFTSTTLDLSNLSRVTYNTLRLTAELICSGVDCPTLNDWSITWSEGISVSGTAQQFNRTASTTSGTVAIAVNGQIQAGRTATIVNGSWTIPNVRAFENDIVTVFIQGAADVDEAVTVTRYDGDGDISGLRLFQRHLALGSNDTVTQSISNADIGLLQFSNTEDVFFTVTAQTLSVCVFGTCNAHSLYIGDGVLYAPNGRIATHDLVNRGDFTAGAFTHDIAGSWINQANAFMAGSTIVFSAATGTVSIDNSVATLGTLGNVTIGTTTGSATVTVTGSLQMSGTLTVDRGTLARGSEAISLGGGFTVGTNGVLSGVGTTTFIGTSPVSWSSQNTTLQNFGRVVIDGTAKTVTLGSPVAAESLTIGADDTLDVSTNNHSLTIYGDWRNQNNFIARSGEVVFAAGTAGRTITANNRAFFNVRFDGTGGGWSFTEPNLSVNNNFAIAAGAVSLPTGTTTVAGSYTVTGGTFAHNNGTINFTAATPRTIAFLGSGFTNVAHTLVFSGSGSWTFTDTNATTTNTIRITQGTVTLPSGTMAIGRTLDRTGGAFLPNNGTIRFYSSVPEVIRAGTSLFNNVTFDGVGPWSFADANVTMLGDVRVQTGSLALPTGNFQIGGSYNNSGTVTSGTGTVVFNSTTTGRTISFGGSSLHNVVFNSTTGGWTVASHGTTTNNFTLTNVGSFTLAPGQRLSVGNVFTNTANSASTTWNGSMLSLEAGSYTINTKTTSDVYGTLAIGSGARIAMWNSSASSYEVPSTASLYSQDHAGVDGDLYIWGGYTRTTGTEHWSHATDFDGTALGGGARQVDVRFAPGASATFASSTLNILGLSTASTTIANQGSGTYTVTVAGGTIAAQYYEFSNLGTTGLSLLGSTTVSTLNDGQFFLGTPGTSGLTVSSTTVNNNPGLQTFRVGFTQTTSDIWLNGYARRKQHTINAAAGAGTNYQIRLNIQYGNGTDSGNTVFLGNQAQADFDDIRFTAADGVTQLPYWIESKVDGANAVVWVRVSEDLSSTARNIFVYYNNPDAVSATNGENTFEFFDDFSGDLSKWVIDSANTDTVSISNGSLRHNPDSSQSRNSFFDTRIRTATYQFTDGAIDYEVFLGGSTASTPRIIHQFGWRVQSLDFENGYAFRTQNNSGDGGTFEFVSGAWNPIGSSLAALTGNVWHRVSVSALGQNYSTVVNGGSPITATDNTKLSAGFLVSHVHGVSLTASSSVLVDNIRVRKLVNPAPTSGAWGTEENASTAEIYNIAQTDGTPTSFWWFRDGIGNLYGEAFDNDTGNPGSIRFDDSSLVLTVAGRVYSDNGITPLTGGTCNGSAQVVRVVVNGGTSYTGSCSPTDGSYSIPGVVVTGDPTLTIYLDNASGGQRGTVVTRTPTGDILDADIYANRVIVRHEEAAPMTTPKMGIFTSGNDSDISFTTQASSTQLVLQSGTELYIWPTKTFTPGGSVTLNGNAGANGFDGTLFIGANATFNAHATSTLTIGGRFVAETGATFNPASTTALFTATTSGKSITAASEVFFNNLEFTGTGGSWNLGANITVNGNMTITAGTVTGTGNITLPFGSLTGNGVLSLGAGTTTLARSNTLGGTSSWRFHNLQLGNGLIVGTTTPVFTATTTIGGRLVIANGHFLDALTTTWDLIGSGTVFVTNGTFLRGSSTIRYSGPGAIVQSATYHNLDINAGSGTQTYTTAGLGIVVQNNLTVGGQSNTIFDVNATDSALAVNGSLTIRNNGTLSASNSGLFTIAGDYQNNGIFNANNGTTTFNGATAVSVAAGASSFANVLINGTGSITFATHATSTGVFTLQNTAGFTVASGQVLAVGGQFLQRVTDGATTWSGSTLRLFGGSNYTINTSTTSDSYDTLVVADTTQVRVWNSQATTYSVAPTASLYSQDHAGVNGDLSIWGSYRNNTAADFWAHGFDFDGTPLGGGARKVTVRFADGASAAITGGSLLVQGSATASTTIQNQGSGNYGLTVGGTASTSWQFYEVRNSNSAGLVFTGTPTIGTLSNGSLAVSQTGGTAMTVGASVITANPARSFSQNEFYLAGATSGFNVTATGTTASAWRFANHYGNIAGEAFDVDPGGDPGFIAWDDSDALITVSGTVYSDEGSTISSICDGVTNNITLRVAGITSYSTSCNPTTGVYSIANVAYGSNDSLVAYIDGITTRGATVSKQPISNIANLDIYHNRVIVRHENNDSITIDDMAVWDATDDADIPFTAINGSPDTLILPANFKLIVWGTKTFAPGGNVTVSGGGGGAPFDGTVQLFTGARWQGAGAELLSVGGSLILDSGAEFTASTGTTTFTTTATNRTIDVNNAAFSNVSFTGSGSWIISDTTFTANGSVTIAGGSLTLPAATSTFNGSFINSGGSFVSNGGQAIFTGAGNRTVRYGGSSFATTTFAGGNYTIADTNATSTGPVTITSGAVTFPSGVFAIGGSLRNLGGTIAHNTSEVVLTNSSSAELQAGGSDLFAVTFAGGGNYVMSDSGATLLDTLAILNSSAVRLASGTLAIGGNFSAAGGTFTNATTTVLFNASVPGRVITPGPSSFYAVQFAAPGGGYTLAGNATTTHNFTIASVGSLVVQSGAVVRVDGVFSNTVGGATTTWTGTTLVLGGPSSYTINTKLAGGDVYGSLIIGEGKQVRAWNSNFTTVTTGTTASLYSQNHNALLGDAHIYGTFTIASSTEHWSYARDFDGANLFGGLERRVRVRIADGATTTVTGGTLNIQGIVGNETEISNQGSGVYAFAVTGGTLNAQYYSFRNLNQNGLVISGTPTVSALSFGSFELQSSGGTLITLHSSALDANASRTFVGNRFATTSSITGSNVTLIGTTSNAWTFVSGTGNLFGEAYDIDGLTNCGSIRWGDSQCLITQQTQYRWRNDDGGAGAPNTEWFNLSWTERRSLFIDNQDASTYTDPVVRVLLPYDSDMRSNFADLRFTGSDGVTPIPFWVGSTTNSVMAEVWLKLPSLPASASSVAYVYYGNPSATSSSSHGQTFIAGDDFEAGSLAAYSGQTGLFATNNSFVFDGAFGLNSSPNPNGRTNLGGIFRFDRTVSRGQRINFKQYVDTTSGSGDEVCTLFGVQSPGTTLNNYAVCLEQFGTDRISLARNVRDNDASGVVLASSTVSFVTGWYDIEIDWRTNNTIDVRLSRDGVLVTSVSASDNTYTSGGIGFAFWFHYGGWDSYTVRPLLQTEPIVRIGGPQVSGGASWKAPQNTPAVYNTGDIARLRVAIENSGLDIGAQQFLLEYAPLQGAPSCEAVSPSTYNAVPTQATCGTSPVCMQTSTFVTNGSTIADLLQNTRQTYFTGALVSGSANRTGSISLSAARYAEIEYVITPTENVTDTDLCFRVTNNGTPYDTYLTVPRMSLQFDPVLTDVVFNNGLDISLIPATTTRVVATATVVDLNGFADLAFATSTMYRSGVSGGAACTPNNNDCYVSTCSFTNCSNDSCTVSCFADIFFHADPTDTNSQFEGQEWFAFIEVIDQSNRADFDTSIGVSLSTLRAIDVQDAINYGALAVLQDTGSANASTTVENLGNVPVNLEVLGTDMTDGGSSVIPAEQQKFSLSAFNYSACVSCTQLSSDTPFVLPIALSKPVVATPRVAGDIYWGIAIPFGVNSAPHSGVNVFTPVSP